MIYNKSVKNIVGYKFLDKVLFRNGSSIGNIKTLIRSLSDIEFGRSLMLSLNLRVTIV